MSDTTKFSPTLEYALLGLLALLWGSSYLFIRVAVAEIPPITLIALRVTIAALFLLVILFWRKERLPRDAKTWRMLFVQSMFTSIGAWSILAWGQQHIDSGMASVLNSTSPVFVFIFTMLLSRHEALNRLKLLGVILGLVGVSMIVGVDVLAGLGQQVAGQIAAIIGAILYACAAIYGTRFTHLSATVTATGTMIWATVILVPLSILVDQPWTLVPSVTAISSAMFLGIFCTGCALLIYFRLVKTLGSMGVASQAYLRSGVGVLLGVVILGEQISPVVGMGIGVAIIGVVALNFPVRNEQKNQP